MSPPVTPDPKSDPNPNRSPTDGATDLGQFNLPGGSSTPPRQGQERDDAETAAEQAAYDAMLDHAIEEWSSPLHKTTDQSKAPPIDFDFVRHASFRGATDGERERLNYLTEHFKAWDRAAVAAVVEMANPPTCGPIEWDAVRSFVRNALSEDDAKPIRMARELSEAWELAIQAAELELAAHRRE